MLEVRYFAHSCADTAKLKWNVSECYTTVAALEEAVQVRRPGGKMFEKLALASYTSGCGSFAPGLDHACPQGPGARVSPCSD